MLLLNRNRIYRKLKFSFLILMVIILFMLPLYWLKNQIGINIFDTISVSKYFPFKYVSHPKIIGINQQGVLFSENFNEIQLFNKWHGIYLEEDGKITKSISSSGINDSRCLLIINREVKKWSISHNEFVTVNIGDNFTYSAKVKISNGSPVANIYMDSFDKNMKILTWGYSKIMFEELNRWVKLVKTFSITDKDIQYIRFRINGVGKGEYRFDDITFERKTVI
jgi:hypothetical protein